MTIFEKISGFSGDSRPYFAGHINFITIKINSINTRELNEPRSFVCLWKEKQFWYVIIWIADISSRFELKLVKQSQLEVIRLGIFKNSPHNSAKFIQFTEFLKKLDACAWSQSNMASYLVALTAEGGIPLFTRTKGDLPQVLNGAWLENRSLKYICTIL
jgi:hypothetical protein